MNKMNPKFAAGRPGAFTLVEVIVVITILALLIGLLLPSVNRAKRVAYLAATKAYISQLSNGALAYQKDHGYYPGQQEPALLGGNLSGTQMLAACVFDIELTGGVMPEHEENEVPQDPPYVPFKKDCVLWNDDGETVYILADKFPGDEQQPLLYYPSRLGNDGSIEDAFVFADNENLLKWNTDEGETRTKVVTAFNAILEDIRFDPTGTQAYKSDSFLLFGKGLDGKQRTYAKDYFQTNSPRNF